MEARRLVQAVGTQVRQPCYIFRSLVFLLEVLERLVHKRGAQTSVYAFHWMICLFLRLCIGSEPFSTARYAGPQI